MNKYKWINGSIWYAVFALLCFIPVWATSNSVLLKTVTLISLVWCVYLWILQASHYTIPNIFKLIKVKPVLKDHYVVVSFLLFDEDLNIVSKTVYITIRLAQGEYSDGYDIEIHEYDGKEFPHVYGTSVQETINSKYFYPWMEPGKEVCVHYKAGRKEWF